MKIILGNKIIDSSEQPIGVVLSEEDRAAILKVPEFPYMYVEYPDFVSDENIETHQKFMELKLG